LLAFLLTSVIVDGPVFRTAQVDVTPDELLPLGGYTARKDAKMEPEGERLFARTLVVEQGATKIAIVSFEALTVPESLYAAVKDRIPAGVDLFLAATHTHSAPDSQMLNERMTFKVPGIASFNRRWLHWYAQKIATCVTAALSAAPIDADSAKLVVAEVSANRGRREGARPGKRATFITVDGRPLITHYAAHGTLYDEKRALTSGDWPGAVSNALGGLVLTGAIGDVSPDFPTDAPRENLSNMVDKLRAGLGGGRVMALFKDRPALAWTSEKIELDKPIPHPDFNKSFGAAPPLDQVLVSRFAPPEASVFLFKLGDVLIIGIPGEPTSEVGRKIESIATQSGFPHVIVVSHTNGWIGYVLTPEDYDRGGYEATLSFHGRGTATRVIEAAERAIKRLAQLPRVAQVR
jgi:neutral ceramidase